MADRLNSPMNTKKIDPSEVNTYTREDEDVIFVFKDIRDYVVITPERLIMVDIKGTGKKINVRSIPWDSVCAWSYETQGVADPNEEFLFELINGKEVIFGVNGKADEVYDILRSII